MEPRAAPPRHPAPDDAAGDPACWLHRVCAACGRVADEERPPRCAACGEEWTAD